MPVIPKDTKTLHQKRKVEAKIIFFQNLLKNFLGEKGSENSLNINLQNVDNNKYLKLYKIDTTLADHNTDFLENSLSFTHEYEDLFLELIQVRINP